MGRIGQSGLWLQKNTSSPALGGAHCLSYSHKEPTLGVPTVRALGVSPWPPGHPPGPVHCPAWGSRASQGTGAGGGVPSLGYWWGDFKLPPGCGSPSSQCVVSVQGTPGWVGEWPLQPPEPRESTRGGGPVVFCCKCLRGTGGADG